MSFLSVLWLAPWLLASCCLWLGLLLMRHRGTSYRAILWPSRAVSPSASVPSSSNPPVDRRTCLDRRTHLDRRAHEDNGRAVLGDV